MVTPTILSAIAVAGLTVVADGDKLVVRPKSRITPDLRNLIRTRRAELLSLLTQTSALTANTADDDWNERAAICEHDAGLCRSEAEAVADACHPALLPAEPADWKAWFDGEVAARIPAMGRADAERRVWGIATDLWHRRHGERPDPHHCAGCGGHVHGAMVFGLPDGAPIHDDHRFLRCLDLYGRRWRKRAAAALAGLGLVAPEGMADEQ